MRFIDFLDNVESGRITDATASFDGSDVILCGIDTSSGDTVQIVADKKKVLERVFEIMSIKFVGRMV